MTIAALSPLRSWLAAERVVADVPAGDASAVLGELAVLLAGRGDEAVRKEIFEALVERERLGSTGTGDGCAIPHARCSRLDRAVLAVARTRHPVDFAAPDGKPVQLFFGLAVPPRPPGLHLHVLAGIARWLRDPAARERLRTAPDGASMLRVLEAEP